VTGSFPLFRIRGAKEVNMVRYVVLLKFTDKGVSGIKESPSRAEAFKTAASRLGATVEAQYWTLGEFDGVLLLSAPDEATASAAVLSLDRQDCVHTAMLRAFDAAEFKNVLAKVS
jgi:uncharacterized protein with GYD domain